MKNLDKHEWEFDKGEKYAIKWFEDRGFDVTIKRRYISKTIFEVTKDGVTDNFQLPQGLSSVDYKQVMEAYGKSFDTLKELVELRRLAGKTAK